MIKTWEVILFDVFAARKHNWKAYLYWFSCLKRWGYPRFTHIMGISDIYVAGWGALLKHTISLCSFYFHILMVSDSLMTHLHVCAQRRGTHNWYFISDISDYYHYASIEYFILYPCLPSNRIYETCFPGSRKEVSHKNKLKQTLKFTTMLPKVETSWV